MSSDNIYQEEEYKGYTIEIHVDEDPGIDPINDWDCRLGTMAFFHRDYMLGDKTDYNIGNYNGWDEMIADVKEREGDIIYLMVRMYDHSGISISTSNSYPYNDRWDSGTLGFIYVPLTKVRKEYSVKRVTKAIREKVIDILENEVEYYNSYMTGYVFGYIIKDEDGEDIHSCWGFIGRNEIDYMISECKSTIDWEIKERERLAEELLKSNSEKQMEFSYV